MLSDYFRLAISGILHRRLRSWLTMIGIFIGIAAVVALISLGEGLRGAVNQQFEDLGADKLFVESAGVQGPPGTQAPGEPLTSKDLNVVKKVRGVNEAAGLLFRTAEVEYKDEQSFNFLGGISLQPDELRLSLAGSTTDIIEGRLFKTGDRDKVILGYNYKYGNTVFDKPVDVRDTIIIQGEEFKVIGIFDKVGNPFDDSSLYIPQEAMKDLYGLDDEYSMIIVQAEPGFVPSEVGDNIEKELRDSRNVDEGEEDFEVSTSEELLATFGDIISIVQGILVGIAAISLLVGGVGIANTMYTSVLERTRDIGIMKSIGAKNEDILLLFLVESGLLGLVGGIIGVLLGVGIGKVTEIALTQAIGSDLITAQFSVFLIIGALLFGVLVGATSGVLPARQASKLKPVDALRYE